MDCIFCRIIKGEIPSNKVYEDENVLVFYDINPECKIHVLVIPKKHIDSVDCVTEENSVHITKVFEAIPKIAKLASITNGYRVITNAGADACQFNTLFIFPCVVFQEHPFRALKPVPVKFLFPWQFHFVFFLHKSEGQLFFFHAD